MAAPETRYDALITRPFWHVQSEAELAGRANARLGSGCALLSFEVALLGGPRGEAEEDSPS